MLRIFLLICLALGVSWFWKHSQIPESPNPDSYKSLSEVLEKKPKAKEELKKAFQQATVVLRNENIGLNSPYDGFPFELVDLLTDPQTDPERLANSLSDFLSQSPEDDYKIRLRILSVVASSPILSPSMRSKISLRQLEMQSTPQSPSEEELEVISKAAEIQADTQKSPEDLAKLYSDLYSLHPSEAAQEVLKKFFLIPN